MRHPGRRTGTDRCRKRHAAQATTGCIPLAKAVKDLRIRTLDRILYSPRLKHLETRWRSLWRVGAGPGAPRLQTSTSLIVCETRPVALRLQDVDARPLEARPPRVDSRPSSLPPSSSSSCSARRSRSRPSWWCSGPAKCSRSSAFEIEHGDVLLKLASGGRMRLPIGRIARILDDEIEEPLRPPVTGRSASVRARLPRDPSGPDRPLRLSHPRRGAPLSA